MNKQREFIPVVVVIIIAVLAVGFTATAVYYETQKDNEIASTNVVITNFEECISSGNPAMESHPRKCIADGQMFVEIITNVNIDTNTNTTAGNTNTVVNINSITPEPVNLGITSNDVRYENSKYSFSFQSPKNLYIWDKTELVSRSLQRIEFNTEEDSKLGDYTKSYMIVKVEEPEVSIVDGKKLYLDKPPEQSKIINGNSFDIYVFKNGYEGTPSFVVARYYANSYNIEISFWGEDSLTSEVEQIISTFKFTN